MYQTAPSHSSHPLTLLTLNALPFVWVRIYIFSIIWLVVNYPYRHICTSIQIASSRMSAVLGAGAAVSAYVAYFIQCGRMAADVSTTDL